MKVCPDNAITMIGRKVIIDQEKCTSCQTCVEACPTGALQLEIIVKPAMEDKPGAIDVIHPQTTNVSLPERSGGGQAALSLAGQYVLPRLVDIPGTFLERHLFPSVPEQIASTNYFVDCRPCRQRKQRCGRFSKSNLGRR
jgi:ferredoxin